MDILLLVFLDTLEVEVIELLVPVAKIGLWGIMGIEMRDFILTVGFIQEALPIRNFIFGKLSRKVVAVMEIHTVPFMQTGLSWRIIKILIIIGSIPVSCPLADGRTLAKLPIVRLLSFLSFRD